MKGCVQRPGYNYVEMFSPVVQMETLRAILSLAKVCDLQIQQMDVKGAYLNGIPKEKVYMHQPDGYNDGYGQVCLLLKMIYRLKQAGCEWNIRQQIQATQIRTSESGSMCIHQAHKWS